MLAFTMQFSRYGRKLGSLGASAPRELKPVSNRVSALRKQLLPQDPTVCSEPFPLSVLVPLLPVGENVLTEQPQKSGPTSAQVLTPRRELVLPVTVKLEYS
jgi:hypothetical protein